jgi:WD40 repeat protein
MDTCVRKSLVATCSVDRTVRIWNFQDNTLEILKEFEEEAYALAFHPTGFHLVVAFASQIALMNLFSNDIVPFFKIPIKVSIVNSSVGSCVRVALPRDCILAWWASLRGVEWQHDSSFQFLHR